MEDLFQFEDLTSTFSVADIVISMVLSFVQTLVLMGMIVSVIMLVVGSNIARAFSLVGALSIIRFRNAIKETRDVGFVFFAMAIGMATGTRFYLLAIIATAVISMVMFMMSRFNWYDRTSVSQMLKADREVVFDRFARPDAGRDRSHGGAGLGLAIVREIVSSHDGEVEIVETPGGGATVRISLPITG